MCKKLKILRNKTNFNLCFQSTSLGVYRPQSYDNLQNGKSSTKCTQSPATVNRLRKMQMHLPISPYYDRNSQLPLLHRTIINPYLLPPSCTSEISGTTTWTTTSKQSLVPPPLPINFRYSQPPRRDREREEARKNKKAAGVMFKKPNRVKKRRLSVMSLDSVKQPPVYAPLPMRPRKHKEEVLFELKSPTNRLTIRECDFGGGGAPDDDESIKDSQIFRVSKRNLYMNHRSPWKERDRYSNLYEYSLNIDLNSIVEDAVLSDSS